jgi:dihydrofolate synthase/folylpolyglutamate synthase
MAVAYDELLRRLFAARRAGVEWGTARVRAVLDRLGAPDRAVGAVVHVGGTNGKGSTAAMIASVAAAAGARAGVYSSPHLTSLRERVRVIAPRGVAELASEDAWCEAAERVWAAGGEGLTFFEQVTAIGLSVLAQARPDVCVLEVGLGGRLDATNAVDAPVAVVTGVAMDHQEYLGDTLRAIAAEKAGIWKRGQRAVIGAAGEPEAVPWLAEAARAAGVASLTIVEPSAVEQIPPRLGLAGAHQRANAAAALAAIDALGELGVVRADATARACGLAEVRHPGRLEDVTHSLTDVSHSPTDVSHSPTDVSHSPTDVSHSPTDVSRSPTDVSETSGAGARRPRIVLDGAHNPHGARALGAWLAAQPERPRALVLAVSADKDVAAIVDALARHVERVIATRYGQPRSLDPDALRILVEVRGAAAERSTALAVDDAPDVLAAIGRAREGGAALIVVAGSLFAVGEARAALVGGPVDPIVVTDPVGRTT